MTFQNLPNITLTEVIMVGSAMLILCVAPAVLAWSDARRRRKALRLEALRQLSLLPPPVPTLATADPIDAQQLWDEPTATVAPDLDEDRMTPGAAVFEASTAAAAATVAAVPDGNVHEQVEVEPAAADTPSTEAPRHQFCLQELRRVRLPNWPPAAVQDDPVQDAAWREAEGLADQHQRDIAATVLSSAQRPLASCLGSAEVEPARARLHFLLFPILWPATEAQATAEAVFEIDRASGEIRSWVNTLRREL